MTTIKKAIEKINAKFDEAVKDDICPSCGDKRRHGVCLKYRCQGTAHKSLLEAITDNDREAIKELEDRVKEGKIIRIM